MAEETPATELETGHGQQIRAFPWPAARDLLVHADRFWLSTRRDNGRAHLTLVPVIWHEGAPHVAVDTGGHEAHNLARDRHCVLTTTSNQRDTNIDLVLEGSARRVTTNTRLHALASALAIRFSAPWNFDTSDGTVHQPDGSGTLLFRVSPTVAFASTTEQGTLTRTRYRF